MPLRDLPMERKFLYSTLAITLTAIAFISIFLIVSEQKTVRGERMRNTMALVGMIANNAAAALVYDDEQVARQVLSGAASERSTTAAALYDAGGKLYAWFPQNLERGVLPAEAREPGAFFTSTTLEAFTRVEVNGRVVGTAFMRTDLSAMEKRFTGYVLTVVVAALTSVFVASLLSKMLQRWIAEPLIALSTTAKTIAVEGNYAIRAKKEGRDEVGELVDAFNHMVQEVELSHQKVQRHAHELEQVVAERTAKLREALSELETFSYSVSHDMRTPLRAIIGYAQILLDNSSNPSTDTADYVERIMRASRRLDQLTRDILNYSRVAKEDLKIEPVDLDRILNDVLSEYPQFSNSQITIDVRRPLGVALGHNAALGQVFSNLIGNAVKFVPEGVLPRIQVWSEERERHRRVFVRDNGVGIADADMSRIFRLFERAPTPGAYEGSGIGLSIVQRAMTKMNGSVGVSSTVGEGSTFWFELADAR